MIKIRPLGKRSFLLLGILLVSFTLRPSITAVGPLIPMMREDLGLSNGWAGFLTTLPLLTFATFSLFSASIGKRVGHAQAILIGMLTILIGSVVRVLGGSLILFIGTGLTGIGIVLCNVLIIPLVKTRMPDKVGKVTGIYTTTMSMMAAIGSAISVPLAKDFGWGWKGSLLFWIIPLVIAILFWIPQVNTQPATSVQKRTTPPVNIWRSGLAWQVSLFMGLQSLLFYTLITWLPDLFIARGISAVDAGLIISFMQVVGLVGTFISPIIALKFKEQSNINLVLGVCYLIGFSLLFSPIIWINVFGICLAGLGMGASISMAYTLITLRTANEQTTAALSGMAQSTGYYLAATGPVLFGVAYDLWHDWNHLIVLMLVSSVLFTGFGYFAGKNRTV